MTDTDIQKTILKIVQNL